MEKNGLTKLIIIVFILFVLVLSCFLPVPKNMGTKGLTTIAIILLAIVLWITDVVPSAVSGMIVILFFAAFDILEFERAAANLGKEIIWLLIATLMMGQAIEKTTIHKRIATNLFLLAKGNLKLIILFLMLFAASLTFFIPSVLGRIILILPICTGLVASIEKQGVRGLGRIVIPALTFIPFLGSFGIITGGGGTLYAVHLFRTVLGKNWSYIEFIVVMGPIVLATILLFWAVVIIFFLPHDKTFQVNQDYLLQEKRNLGKLSYQEIQVIGIYTLLLILWITKQFHGFSLAMSAVFSVSLLFFPGIKILNWKEAVIKIDWSILFVFAAGFSIADALEASDISKWLSLTIQNNSGDIQPLSVALILLFSLVIIRIGFMNYTMMIAAFMPLVFTFADSTSINPVWLGMIALIGSSICFFLPMQTISGMMALSMGHHSVHDHFRMGLTLTIITICVTLIFAFFYWPFIGLEIYRP